MRTIPLTAFELGVVAEVFPKHHGGGYSVKDLILIKKIMEKIIIANKNINSRFPKKPVIEKPAGAEYTKEEIEATEKTISEYKRELLNFQKLTEDVTLADQCWSLLQIKLATYKNYYPDPHTIDLLINFMTKLKG